MSKLRSIGGDNLFRKMRNRVRVLLRAQNPETQKRNEGHKTQKSMIPNFFARNALISLISAKKKATLHLT